MIFLFNQPIYRLKITDDFIASIYFLYDTKRNIYYVPSSAFVVESGCNSKQLHFENRSTHYTIKSIYNICLYLQTII